MKVAPLARILVAVLILSVAPTAANADPITLGPKPAKCGVGCWAAGPNSLPVSWLGDVNLSPHIAHVGQKITAVFSPTGNDTPNWPAVTGRVKGCGTRDRICVFKVTQPTYGWMVFRVSINNGIGYAESDDAYAVVGKKIAVIQGYTYDKSGFGVGGVHVHANGTGRAREHYAVDSGGDGFYNILVQPGTYRVEPSGGPRGKKPNKFYPERVHVHARGGRNTRADFYLQMGLEVTLTLDRTSVPGDGFQVVHGTIETKEFGKPRANVTVALWPKPLERADVAVTSGPRAAICNANGSRIWPTGTLAQPDGLSVNVQTDQNGQYQFTLTVGTVPGAFPIEAWARDGYNQLITHDLGDVTDEQTLTVTPTGGQSPGGFVTEFDSLAKSTSQPALQLMGGGSESIAQTLGVMSQSGGLGGLAYSVGSGATGNTVVVHPQASPPSLNQQGQVTNTGLDSRVLSPSEWVGTSLVNITDLHTVLQQGRLTGAPTLTQWTQGASGILGWNLHPDTMSTAASDFRYFGWAYPTSPAGACY